MMAENGSEIGLDRELLARAEQRWGRADARSGLASDPLRLASYLDGRADEREREAVEAELADDPEVRQIWMHASEAVGSYEAPPSLLLRKVEALAPAGFAAPVTFLQRMSLNLAAARPIDGFAWAAAAVLFVMICLGGFELGTYGYSSAQANSTYSSQSAVLPFGPTSMF